MNYAENHPARTAFKRKLIETDLGQLYLWLSGIHVRPAANRRRLSCPDRIAERSTDYRTNMQEIVDLLRDEHGWSDSVSNLSNKLQRESLRYVEAVQLADALGYEIVWQKRR